MKKALCNGFPHVFVTIVGKRRQVTRSSCDVHVACVPSTAPESAKNEIGGITNMTAKSCDRQDYTKTIDSKLGSVVLSSLLPGIRKGGLIEFNSCYPTITVSYSVDFLLIVALSGKLDKSHFLAAISCHDGPSFLDEGK